jgi:uncharacterized protein involved in exopolysaccharide biosynthesis
MSDRIRRSEFEGVSAVQADDDAVSIVALLNVVLRRRRFILGLAIGATALVALGVFLAPRKYSVGTSFIIQNSDQSAAASLATKLGVDVGGVDATQSPQFYVSLIKTPVVLERLADGKYATATSSVPRTLEDIWKAQGSDANERRAEVLRELDQAISSSLGLKLDLVSVNVTTRDPSLSRELASAVLAEINHFNLETRQSRAGRERRFTEQRMGQVRTELRLAEDALQRFLEQNRQQFRSAAVELEKDRLSRQTQLLQQTYMTLATSFERARIDEVRDTPVITVIQQPAAPRLPDPRGLVSKSVLTFCLALALGVLVAFFMEVVVSMRASANLDAQEFTKLLSEASGGVKRLRGALPGLGRTTHNQHVS